MKCVVRGSQPVSGAAKMTPVAVRPCGRSRADYSTALSAVAVLRTPESGGMRRVFQS